MAVVQRQSSALPPAQPSYILRGHASQIHSVQFVRQNSRLLTGDADGWIIYWKLETKRALAVWRAHDGAILGAAEWERDKFITHGRDNSLRIWQLRVSDESGLSTVLPAEDATAHRPKPWLLHTLPVNTLNFCAFSLCDRPRKNVQRDGPERQPEAASEGSILIAVPARDDKKIEIYQFPEEKLKCAVPRVQGTDTGMVMAVKLAQHPASNSTLALVGYEGGHTAIHQILHNDSASLWPAELVYLSQPHSQPVLSLDITPDAKTYFTSAADAIIAAHRVPDLSAAPLSGRQARTALPERSPAYNKGMPQPQSNTPTSNLPKDPSSQSPPTSLTFAKQPIPPPQSSSSPSKPTGISSLLASAPPPSTTIFPAPLKPLPRTVQPPHKSTNTKHAGQQSLRVRSDGRVLVTGGWDSRIRMYSTATLKEIAVLKWHKEGVYAVDFAQILTADQWRENDGDERKERETGLGKLQKQREEQMQVKRWVVGGAKDGKVSLWEVG